MIGLIIGENVGLKAGALILNSDFDVSIFTLL
jgi:hypothetical protein